MAFLVLVGAQVVELLLGFAYLWATVASDPGPPGSVPQDAGSHGDWAFAGYGFLGPPIALLALATARSPKVRLVRRIQVLAVSVTLCLAMITVVVLLSR